MTTSAAIAPPGPRPRFSAVNLIKFRRDPLKFFTDLFHDYGDITSFKIGSLNALFVSNPEYIREILVTQNRNLMKSRGLEMAKRFLGEGLLTSEGEFHLSQRRLMQPAFHRERIAGYGKVMADYTARTRERWKPGSSLEVWQEMMRLTLSIAGKTLFDADVEAEAQAIGMAMRELILMFDRITLPFAEVLAKLPLPSNYRFERACNRLDSIVYGIIDDRRSSGKDPGDLLSMLLATGNMTNQQVRDEAMTLFLAGHETTATALTWTWYLLSQNPAVEAKLHEEIDSVLGGNLPTADDVPRLKYTEKVFTESMRIYPPVWRIGRRVISGFELGPYSVAPGSMLIMSQYVVHHDPRFYPDPYRFDPERWTPEARATRPSFSYFPFGGGPRVCIGESFAWMEGVLVLATLAQRWRLRLAPDQTVGLMPMVTLRPKHGMRMTAEPR